MPNERPTQEVDRYEVILALLRSTDADVKGLRKDFRELAEDTKRQIRDHVDETESRFRAHSIRAKSESSANLTQDAAISTIVTDVAELKASQKIQLAVLGRLDKVTKDPRVAMILFIVYHVMSRWAESRGIL